jgi:hypothetical protein
VPATDGFLCGWTITEDFDNGNCPVTVGSDYRSLNIVCDAAPKGFWSGGGHAAIFVENVNVVKTLNEAKTCVKNSHVPTGEMRLVQVGCDNSGSPPWPMCGWTIGNVPANLPAFPCPTGIGQCSSLANKDKGAGK